MLHSHAGTIEPVHERHDLAAFDCGEDARNAWLVKRALPNQTADFTRTYVIADGRAVLGFYALTLSSVVRGAMPSAMRRNAPDPLSGVLLAQLAVDRSHQRRGLSKDLVLHAMMQAARIAELMGCRLFTVSPARRDLVPFYARFGLAEVAATPALMAMTMAQVRATLAALAKTAAF